MHTHMLALPVSLTILALCVIRGLCSSPFLHRQSFPRAAAAEGTLWEVACHKPHLGLLAERRLSKSKIMFLIKSSPGWCIMVDEFPEATEACPLLPCAWYSCCSSKAEQMSSGQSLLVSLGWKQVQFWTLTETPLGYPTVAWSYGDPAALIPLDQSLHAFQQAIDGIDVGVG